MIPQIKANEEWQQQLKSCTKDVVRLLDKLGVNISDFDLRHATLPVRVPQSFIDRMEYGNKNCPLLRQVLPLRGQGSFGIDPLQEQQIAQSGLLHKFKTQLLLTTTGSCAIHCQYCFRQHYPYSDNSTGRRLDKVINYLDANPEITEVILSGGDPLTLKDKLLDEMLSTLASRGLMLRIHTRLPVVIPARVTDKLVEIVKRTNTTIVLHANHANEISGIEHDLLKLSQATMTFNQSVLLAGVNDSATAIVNLSHKLKEAQVVPYYLHFLDPVAGAEAYHVDRSRALTIYKEASALLPGYLLPKLVQEVPGAAHKVQLHD